MARRRIGAVAQRRCRKSMTYAVLLLMMTWADAEFAFRGRGPPPVPRRISLVFALLASLLRRSFAPAANMMVPARMARRLEVRHEWLLVDRILQRRHIPHQRANRFNPVCRLTGSYPETGFEEINSASASVEHRASQKLTSDPE